MLTEITESDIRKSHIAVSSYMYNNNYYPTKIIKIDIEHHECREMFVHIYVNWKNF